MLLSCQQAMRAALDATELAFRLSGAGAAHMSMPVQRCFRDLSTARLHLAFSDDRLADVARVQLGLEDPKFPA